MKKFYNDPEAELIEIDALVSTDDITVSGDLGEDETHENINNW